MTPEKKKKIDSLWINTDCGKWVLAKANGNEKTANEIKEKMFAEHPCLFSLSDKELSHSIIEECGSVKEHDEYLRLLSKENYKLVDFMIRADVLMDYEYSDYST